MPHAPMRLSMCHCRTVAGIDYFKIADKLDVNLERMDRKRRWTLDETEVEQLRLRCTAFSLASGLVLSPC